MKREKPTRYFTPSIQVVVFDVEQGFTLSAAGSAGWEGGSAEDGNVNDLGSF